MGNGLCGGYEARIEREEELDTLSKIVKLKKLIDDNPELADKLADVLLSSLEEDREEIEQKLVNYLKELVEKKGD